MFEELLFMGGFRHFNQYFTVFINLNNYVII